MYGPNLVGEPLGRSRPDLGRIHRRALSENHALRRVLADAQRAKTLLTGGLGRDLDRETAWIDDIRSESVLLITSNFDLTQREDVALTFNYSGSRFLFAGKILEIQGSRIRVSLPDALYIVERRDRERRSSGADKTVPTLATIRHGSGAFESARVEDYSYDGVLISLPDEAADRVAEAVELTFADGPEAGLKQTGFPTNRRSSDPGWTQIGMRVTAAPPGPPIPIERRSEILEGGRARGGWRRIKLAGDGARLSARRALERVGFPSRLQPELDLVEFESTCGEKIVGLRDSWRFHPGAPVVIMPPAWAKTKETLLPLARTIVSTFRRASQPIAVLRLDGVRRRGESYRDPEFRAPGAECLGMTFSQGAEDIRSAIRFVSKDPSFESSCITLVTFSGASIEARKVLAEDEFRDVAGWVSVVGAADLHSGLRVLSGGQDYVGGYERGVRFGRQRVLGIDTNADLVCDDAIRNGLAYLEDARRQMANIRTPITWLQGRDDAWIDPEKVREILSCGDTANRRLVEIPTGHQLRTSLEALDVFQLISSEIGRFVTGHPIRPELPNLADLDARRSSERRRMPKAHVNLEEFWHDYVLGDHGLPGMEILTSTAAYREMMAVQIRELHLRGAEQIADLGSGTGTLTLALATARDQMRGLQVDEFDFLQNALTRSRVRKNLLPSGPKARYVRCDLNLKGLGQRIPVKDGSYDAAVLSLLINYVSDPTALLLEARRIVRTGGRLVVASLRPDTDISKIYVDSADEVRRRKAAGDLSELSYEDLEAALASCLNEAARLVDLEEQGYFHFWEPEALARMVRDAGFGSIKVHSAFGHPPQAIVVSGEANPE